MQSIESILDRNNRVEADKAWETSNTRRVVIASITYVVAAVFMWRIEVADFFINALIPTGGYLISTLSLTPIKKQWLKNHILKTKSRKEN